MISTELLAQLAIGAQGSLYSEDDSARLDLIIARGSGHSTYPGMTVVEGDDVAFVVAALDRQALDRGEPARQQAGPEMKARSEARRKEMDPGSEAVAAARDAEDADPTTEAPTKGSKAEERHDFIRRGVSHAELRDHYRGEFESIRRRRPSRVDSKGGGAGNTPLMIEGAEYDQVWSWVFNRHLIYEDAGPGYPEYDLPPTGRKVPVKPPTLSTRIVGTSLRNVQFEAPLWVFRSYNNHDVVLTDNDWSPKSVQESTPEGPIQRSLLDQHVGYWEQNGSVEWARNWVENTGGHGHYSCYRPFTDSKAGASNRFYEESPTFELKDSYFVNTDMNPAWGSFSVQWFNPGDLVHPGTVVVDGFVWLGQWNFIRSQSSWDPIPYREDFKQEGYVGRSMNTNGCFVVHHYDFEKHVARAAAMGATNTHPTESFTLRNFLMRASFALMPVAAIRGVREVRIEDGAFHADERHISPRITIDDLDSIRTHSRAELVVVKNVLCTGLARIAIGAAAPDGSDILFPQDLVGKVATWRPGMASPDVQDLALK